MTDARNTHHMRQVHKIRRVDDDDDDDGQGTVNGIKVPVLGLPLSLLASHHSLACRTRPLVPA